MIGKSFKDGAKAAMPTALGYVSIGLACGIIGASYVSPLEMVLMSSLVYAGSAQFTMLALLAIHAPVTAIALTVFFNQFASIFARSSYIYFFSACKSLAKYWYRNTLDR